MDHDNFAPKGIFTIQVFDKSGNLLEEHVEENLIVNKGKYNLIRLLGGNSANRSVTDIAFGEGTSAAAAGDTALTNAYTKNISSVSYPDTSSVVFNWTLGSGEANGKAITEFGLIHQNGDLFNRRVRSVINKTSDISLAGTWKIQF